ncbi:MAG: RES family NAD+ phosphorylase [Pelotomaculum sp.]
MLRLKRSFINPDMRIFRSYIEHLTDYEIKETDGPFYRARKNTKGKKFTHSDLEAPEWYLCKSGRLNPVGISYLYVSDSISTCCAEVRPWIGANITVAKFYPIKSLILKDLRITKEELKAESSSKRAIKRNFSKPISVEDNDLDYLITQCVTEYIRDFSKPKTVKYERYDGIVYTSSIINKGLNFLLYNPKVMKIEKEEPLQTITVKDMKIHLDIPGEIK